MEPKVPSGQTALSPVRTTRMISSKSLQDSNSPQKLNKDPILMRKQELDTFLDDLDGRLKKNYAQKEETLLRLYKEQLLQAHRQLNDLKTKTNEKQILSEFENKKFQMKKERLELVQLNMLLSNKCQQFKKQLSREVSQGAEYERQIKFLEKQLQTAAQKKVHLMAKLYQKNNLPLQTTPNKFQDDNIQHQRINSNFSGRQVAFSKLSADNSTKIPTEYGKRGLSFLKENSSIKQQNKAKKDRGFTAEINKLFDSKLQTDKNPHGSKQIQSFKKQRNTRPLSQWERASGNTSKTFLPSKEKKQSPNQQLEKCFEEIVNKIKEKRSPQKILPCLAHGEEFTEVEKKEIAKAFLSKEQVKQYIYSILFEGVSEQQIRKTPKKLLFVKDQLQSEQPDKKH